MQNQAKRHISGVQPSGRPHLGNYFGAIKPHILLSNSMNADDSLLLFVANYHALTSVKDPAILKAKTLDIAATYLALGLDCNRATLFLQSDIPEVTELAWLLATVTNMGLLQRAHSYKDKTANGVLPSVGLFTYPVLMAADILSFGSTDVPVGQDQIRHVEMAQDMAKHFNATYGQDILTVPAPLVSPTAKLAGTDGRKMSKSYNNTIDIFAEGKELSRQIKSIVTDSRPANEPKDPVSVGICNLLCPFLSEQEDAAVCDALLTGNIGYGDLKDMLTEKINSEFGEARERYAMLASTDSGKKQISDLLSTNAAIVRPMARHTLDRCRAAVGL